MTGYQPLNRNIKKTVPGSWTAMNDIEVSEDGVMYWAVYEYLDESKGYAEPLTQYDLTAEFAWAMVDARNRALGLVQDSVGYWYQP